MAEAVVLQTERLTLVTPEAGHFPAYRQFYASANDLAGRYSAPRREDEAWTIMAGDIGHWSLRGFGMFVVTRKSDGDVIGGCGLYHPQGWPSHELTWWLLPTARGTGFATEASRAVIGFGYDRLGWPQVETYIRDNNGPARRLAERLGGLVDRREIFPDGVERDVFRLPHPTKEAAA